MQAQGSPLFYLLDYSINLKTALGNKILSFFLFLKKIKSDRKETMKTFKKINHTYNKEKKSDCFPILKLQTTPVPTFLAGDKLCN